MSALLAELPSRLQPLYGAAADDCAGKIHALVAQYAELMPQSTSAAASPWTERDVVLITYADQISASNEAPLATLHRFLLEEKLDALLSTVHLLPFCPYSSDDGFSVIDYLAVDPNSGDWDDLARLAADFYLMFDLVLNHISQHSAWFQKYLAGEPPYDRFFIEVAPSLDLSAVVRPRSLPLLTPFETSRGTRHVWTTFSDDQIDLNYAEPEVLVRMLGVLLEYARRGARIVRLDAVAFLWKQVGTSSIHLPETHAVVKLMRDVVAAVAPQVLMLTETNVPHRENVSYFGNGDEAHMVYQFSLPPLLLDAFVNEDATLLAGWLRDLEPPRPGTTYFNFTASHDGIGVRPLEGLVTAERLERLCDYVRARGGRISTRRQADGSDTPYELNVTYVDALAPADVDQELHARRFLATQAAMLALQGMPAVYVHSLLGTRNDQAGVETSGQPRRINRHKYEIDELRSALDGGLARRIYDGYRRLLEVRIAQAAFHPDATQRVVETDNPALLAFERTSTDGGQRILVAVNVSGLPQAFAATDRHDLIGDAPFDGTLAPGEAVWLV
jgi:sucrose phosphorylase